MIIRILIYVGAIILANLLVLWYGKYGLWLSSALLIPFDFVMRCYFHERWKGTGLVFRLGLLITSAALATYLINQNSLAIAIASVTGFIFANIMAGLVYQMLLEKPPFYKVNGSDFAAIMVDSVVFQAIAFGSIDPVVMFGQTAIKMIGGLFWFWVLFHVIKIRLKP
jgi:queuosine precursor transporter